MINYRPIDPDQCAAVVQLHRHTFVPARFETTVYASEGIHHYLSSLLQFSEFKHESNKHFMYGAWDGDKIVGYVHGRALPVFWHLNYIAVAPVYQGYGIGRQLWRKWLQMGQQLGYQRFSLDVEQNNHRARKWYERQGLQEVSMTWLHQKELDDVSTVSCLVDIRKEVHLRDWENAQAWHAAFGFSMIHLMYHGQEWPVGRLGQRFYRVEGLLPPQIETLLREIDGERQLLITSAQQIPRLHVREVSLRMQGDLD